MDRQPTILEKFLGYQVQEKTITFKEAKKVLDDVPSGRSYPVPSDMVDIIKGLK